MGDVDDILFGQPDGLSLIVGLRNECWPVVLLVDGADFTLDEVCQCGVDVTVKESFVGPDPR